jgi:ribosomal protein S18 acetylase RimI-like enzyme
MTPRLVLAVIATMGPIRALRLPHRLRVRARVAPKKPPDAYVIAEIHVAPAYRGRGCGAEILAYAERDARSRGFSEMALHTLTTNPAQRAYRRAGFETMLTLTDPEFRELTGVDGNVLMVRRLA